MNIEQSKMNLYRNLPDFHVELFKCGAYCSIARHHQLPRSFPAFN